MALIYICGGTARADLALPVQLSVAAGAVERLDTPIDYPLAGIATPTQGYTLTETTALPHAAVPFSIAAGSPPHLEFILGGVTASGATRTFLLEDATTPAQTNNVASADDGDSVNFTHEETLPSPTTTPIMSYRHSIMPQPVGQSALYARGAYIHPLLSPQGDALTQIQPADHYHHMGIIDAWAHTNFRGHFLDIWNIQDDTGLTRFKQFNSVSSGAVWGGYGAVQEAVDTTGVGAGEVVLNDDIKVKIYASGGPGDFSDGSGTGGNTTQTSGFWIVDYTSTQTNITNADLTLDAYRYGGFGYRGPAAWNTGNSNYLTDLGKTRANADGTSAKWTDCWGATAHGTAGILFMSNPANFSYPEPIRAWDDGLMFLVITPMRDVSKIVGAGQSYTRKYRMIVHQGALSAAQANRWFNDWANPPVVTAIETTPVKLSEFEAE